MNKVAQYYRELVASLSERLRNGERDIDALVEQARERVPVDTGALRRSLAVRADGMSARVTAGTPYAAYVELGTGGARGQMPQPYMRPAFEAGAAQAARRALEVIG